MPPSVDGGIVVYGLHQGEGRQQSSLFPPTLEELVPEDHLVRVIEAYVARLELQALGFSKAEPLKQVNDLQRIYAVRGDCTACPLKSRCTKAKRRYVTRHVHEAAFERLQHRM